MKNWKRARSVDADGTHLQGYLRVPYSQLVKKLGQPDDAQEGGQKVSTEWVLRFVDGTIVTIYDYKATSLYHPELPTPAELRASEYSNWHVGGADSAAIRRLRTLFPGTAALA